MKRTANKIFLILFTVISNLAYAQENLVPNPSFEEYTDCPDGWNTGNSFYLQDWFSASGGTPDFFNSCSTNFFCTGGVPCNVAGFQYAKEGSGYAGVVTYGRDVSFSLREFFGVMLVSPLVQGVKYYVSMYVSPTIIEDGSICCLSSNIGFKFTNTMSVETDNVAQVYCDSIILDTLGWTRISGSFIADSGYRYLFIGNFFEDAHTNAVCCNVVGTTNAYNYIDMVSVFTDSVTVGINNLTSNHDSFQIYPNPAKEVVYIDKKKGTIDYTIIDAMGSKIQSENNYSQNQINVENLPNGIYFLSINNQQAKRISIIH